MKVLAIDVSTKTGFCWSTTRGYKTKQLVRAKETTNEGYFVDLYYETSRLASYTDLVILEDYAFGAMGRAKTLLAELGGVVKLALISSDVPFITVTPTQWKTYVLGSSHAKKEDIKTIVYKRFKQDFSDKSNDECDAFCMWHLGRMLGAPDDGKVRTKAYDALRGRVREILSPKKA